MQTEFFPIFNSILASMEGKSVVANSQTIAIPSEFFNRQPYFRNPDTQKYPGMVVSLQSPIAGDLIVNEDFRCEVTVTAAPPYLEGVKVATISISDGETIEFTREFLGAIEIEEEVISATFSSGDFANPPDATPAEVATVLTAQLTGVAVSVEAGDIVRVTHDDADSNASLRVSGGTATNLIASFPIYTVYGRDAGTELQIRNPPGFYHFIFHVIHKSDRFDHHAHLVMLCERLFLLPNSPNQRAIKIDGESFEVSRGHPVDDPLVSEGVFITTVPFTLRNVPVLLDEHLFETDNFNGGNFNGDGVQSRDQVPLDVEFTLNVTAVAFDESLT